MNLRYLRSYLERVFEDQRRARQEHEAKEITDRLVIKNKKLVDKYEATVAKRRELDRALEEVEKELRNVGLHPDGYESERTGRLVFSESYRELPLSSKWAAEKQVELESLFLDIALTKDRKALVEKFVQSLKD